VIQRIKKTNSFINKRLLLTTTIDGRKNNWLGCIHNNNILFGKLSSNKQEVNNNNIIKIIHYLHLNNSKGRLHLTECKIENCIHGQKLNGKCIILVEKSCCLRILGKFTKHKNISNYITLNQQKNNIINELIRISSDKNFITTNY